VYSCLVSPVQRVTTIRPRRRQALKCRLRRSAQSPLLKLCQGMIPMKRRGRRRGRPLFQSPPGRRRRSPAGRQRRKRRVPVLLQARARSRRCSKPGPAAGAAASLGPPQPAPVLARGAGDRRTWGRGINAHQLRNLMHRTCRSRFNQAERRGEPDQPKTGSNNQEDKYQDING